MVFSVKAGQCGGVVLENIGTLFGMLSITVGLCYYGHHSRRKSRVAQAPLQEEESDQNQKSVTKLRIKGLCGFVWWIVKRVLAVLPWLTQKETEDDRYGFAMLVGLDVLCSLWAAIQGEYQPGSLYNQAYQMTTGSKLPKVYSDANGFSWMWKTRILLCLIGTFIAWQENVFAVASWIGCGEGNDKWQDRGSEFLAVLFNTWTVFMIYPVIVYGVCWAMGVVMIVFVYFMRAYATCIFNMMLPKCLQSSIADSTKGCKEYLGTWLFSPAGTTSYAIWTVFYERIETHVFSDSVDLLGLLDLQCLGLSAPTLPELDIKPVPACVPAVAVQQYDAGGKQPEEKSWDDDVEGKLAKKDKNNQGGNKGNQSREAWTVNPAYPPSMGNEVSVPERSREEAALHHPTASEDGVQDAHTEKECVRCSSAIEAFDHHCGVCGAAQPSVQDNPVLLPGQIAIPSVA